MAKSAVAARIAADNLAAVLGILPVMSVSILIAPGRLALEHVLAPSREPVRTKASRNPPTSTSPRGAYSFFPPGAHRTAVSPCLSSSLPHQRHPCLLYTSDAADEEDSVDLGGRRIIK